MPTDVIMPALGIAQEKGTLVNWFKAEGEPVKKGEPLMEVETDKATVEIESPASGILAGVSASPGDEVPVGQRIALILAPGESLPAESEAAPAPPREHPLPRPLPEGEGRGEGVVSGKILASPKARRIAREKGIDLAALKGSGPEGSILAEDVLGAESGASPIETGRPNVKEVVPLSAMRRIIGERMAQSKQTAPHFYLSVDVDMTEVSRKRATGKEQGADIVPSINDFIVQACARGLKSFPGLNSTLTNRGVELLSDINIGIAVALEEGLVVPVIRNADRLSLTELAGQSRALAERAQQKKLFPLDYEGGTFTVSNLGMFGVDHFIAIINPPQCAILAVGQVARRVVASGESIAARPMMTMTLSADHRIADGAMAAKFLQEVKGLLEKPTL
ncbi:MAG: 2-oxo acid dehydrogenase subunit E2 [Deltaproteobacteria bacterium]|nr:2-oxo acid dehydrogenase subunit E2 [Deltaproteobacteria bacterium]